ncbi:restriction endonuclease subunit S [Ascidiaceihabitans sp.]|uniref:restriction endonuclease subunit S n=1 Tax=Ascidiaceihabitans sp. TaxID=1872644 RepID=UPI003296E506
MTSHAILKQMEIPHSWGNIQLRWISRRYAGGTPDKNNPDYWEEGTIPWLNSGVVNQGTVTKPSAFITELALKESSAKWIPADGLVIALAGQGKTKGMVGHLALKTTGNQSLAAVVPTAIQSRFLYWWLSSQYMNIRNLSSQDGRDGLNLEMIGGIRCPVPPTATQKKIAAFLDEKTEQIDGLIEKKRALLERLAEKRQALIIQAVTKGLNPNAPMKDSGIDWLGQVPEHWEIVKAAWYFGATKGRDAQQYTKDFCAQYPGEIPVYSGQTENGGILGHTDHFTYDLGDKGCIFSTTVGAKAMDLKHIYGKFCLSQNCMILVPKRSVNLRFYFHHLVAVFAYERGLIPAHMQPSFRVDDFYNFRIAEVPLDEQKEISEYLDTECGIIEKTAEPILQSIALLEEYRAALISSAVTGKLLGLQ